MKKIFFVLLAAMLTQPIFSQYYYHNNKYYESDLTFEIGGSIGMMNCLTDLGGRKGIGKGFIKDLNLKNSNFDAGVFFMASYQNKVAVRLEATMGSIEAYDSILKKVKTSTYGRYERNLSFRSEIRELQLSVEVHPLFILNNYDEEPPRFSPYAIAGIGLFSFDPEAKLDGNWIRLQPLRTEGQGFREYRDRKPYHLTQFNFPVGIGVRYELNDNLNVRMELVHRILTTDYLDDVSKTYINPDLFPTYLSPQQAALAQRLYDRHAELDPAYIPKSGEIRGDPKNNDSYFSLQLKLSYSFGRERR